MAELNAFHGKLRGLIEANQAVANEAKRIADAEDARTLDADTITNLALLFFDALAVSFKCGDDDADEPTHEDLHTLGKVAAKSLGLTEPDVNALFIKLCALAKDISDDSQTSPLFRPAPKKKRPRAT
jgi:hypothetical protein